MGRAAVHPGAVRPLAVPVVREAAAARLPTAAEDLLRGEADVGLASEGEARRSDSRAELVDQADADPGPACSSEGLARCDVLTAC